jgi:dTDP-4-amino-4,6-dideoxygalactose transaminase
MTDVQAAIGIKQLEKLDWIVAERRKIASWYKKHLSGVMSVLLPADPIGYFSNYQSYPVYLKDNFPVDRNTLMQRLLNDGISTRSGIMTSHRETAYRDFSQNISLPVSEDACDRSILLPLYVPMEEGDVIKVSSLFVKL